MSQILPSGKSYTVIHYQYPTSDKSPPEYRIACMPNMTEFHQTPHHPAVRRSNATAAVTCLKCKETSVYREAKTRNG